MNLFEILTLLTGEISITIWIPISITIWIPISITIWIPTGTLYTIRIKAGIEILSILIALLKATSILLLLSLLLLLCERFLLGLNSFRCSSATIWHLTCWEKYIISCYVRQPTGLK